MLAELKKQNFIVTHNLPFARVGMNGGRKFTLLDKTLFFRQKSSPKQICKSKAFGLGPQNVSHCRRRNYLRMGAKEGRNKIYGSLCFRVPIRKENNL